MKRTLISLALVAASSAAFAGGMATAPSVSTGVAYQVCDGKSTGGKTDVWGGDGQKLQDPTKAVFTQQGFTIQCSANVNMFINESTTNLAGIASASAKGNQAFAGTSNGGAIAAGAACAATGCADADVSSALGSALSAATATGGAGGGTGGGGTTTP